MGRLALVAVVTLAVACHGKSGPVAPPDLAVGYAFAAHDKVDLLFMMDDSPGIPYRIELVQRFPQFHKSLVDAGLSHPASYHIGVITSDLGAGPEVLNQGQCHPGGDGGRLQTTARAGAGAAGCTGAELGGGLNFIDYDQIAGTSNVADVSQSFGCIALGVGSAGCGFEHQLESTYRALHDPPPENAGFLRDDALLVILFVTDEDDCSAPPDTDLFDRSPDGIAKYGALHSFRCTQFGIRCGEPPMPLPSTEAVAPRSDCRPLSMAAGGKLFDVQRYVDFFARAGGVKADPSDVILASIAAPPSPFATQLTSPCADQANTPQCPILDHSCISPANSAFFGDPAVRIAAVVSAAATSQQSSLCETDDTAAVQALADKIIARLR